MSSRPTSPVEILAEITHGTNFTPQKYCLDENPHDEPFDDSLKDFLFENYGETQKPKSYVNLEPFLEKLTRSNPKPLFSYFLDGSRRTYKVGDIQYGERVYPIIAGQLGVACCERVDKDTFRNVHTENRVVICIPISANADGKGDDLSDPFYSKLTSEINEQSTLQRIGLKIDKVIPYPEKSEFEYTNLAIATLHQEMMDMEKEVVNLLVREKQLLNYKNRLIKDGSIEYQKSRHGDFRDLSTLISNYQNIVGVSKRFNPEKCVDKNNKSNAGLIAELPLYQRTPAFRFKSQRSGSSAKPIHMVAWYVRIRATNYTISPFDGVLKVERILANDNEQEKGLDTEEVNLISANLIWERNPTCYGKDTRWANHLYPVYLTELSMKSRRLSDQIIMSIL